MGISIKVCEKCDKPCIPFPSSYNKHQASEWYCKPCHKSYPMGKDVAQAMIIEERRRG